MALIVCPECGKNISDKASACPHCGLPAEFFVKKSTTVDTKGGSSNSDTGLPNMPKDVNLQNLGNILVSFDKDYVALFNQNHYVSSREKNGLIEVYGPYYKYLKDKYVFGYVCNHAKNLRVDIDALKRFLTRIHHLESDTEVHNTAFVDLRLDQDKEYFDHILEKIDPVIVLDEEQRRAVITDDDYCLLVAGAGAGKTTTMAAKVKYLVDRQGIRLEEIIVISYTNKGKRKTCPRIANPSPDMRQ